MVVDSDEYDGKSILALNNIRSRVESSGTIILSSIPNKDGIYISMVDEFEYVSLFPNKEQAIKLAKAILNYYKVNYNCKED